MSVTVGFLALLEAKPDKAAELAAFLEQGRELALAEPLTVGWYAFRIDQVAYGIFDTSEAEAGPEAHQASEIATALMAAARELLARDPVVRPVDVIAVKRTHRYDK
jgi:quinol monooxygenase YgiN